MDLIHNTARSNRTAFLTPFIVSIPSEQQLLFCGVHFRSLELLFFLTNSFIDYYVLLLIVLSHIYTFFSEKSASTQYFQVFSLTIRTVAHPTSFPSQSHRIHARILFLLVPNYISTLSIYHIPNCYVLQPNSTTYF